MKYDIDPDSYSHFSENVHGTLPFRGLLKHEQQQAEPIISQCGYFQYNSKKEMIALFHSELQLFPEINVCLGNMSAKIDEKTMLFEGDRCVCQWKIWGYEWFLTLISLAIDGMNRKRLFVCEDLLLSVLLEM